MDIGEPQRKHEVIPQVKPVEEPEKQPEPKREEEPA